MSFKKTPFLFLATLMCAGTFVVSQPRIADAFPSVFNFGTTIFKAGKVQPGPVFYVGPGGTAYLIGMGGGVIRSWTSPIPGTTFALGRPLMNGNFLASIRDSGVVNTIVEMDIDGNVVWQWDDTNDRYDRLHHDIERRQNGNTLVMCSQQITVPEISPIELQDDCLFELDPAGNIVWEWQMADHFDELGLSDEDKALIFATGGDWAHGNAASPIPPNNLGDPRFRAGNVIVSSRHINMVFIVDRMTGEIVWTLDSVTIGQHHSHMILPPLPGGGNILIFDNGLTDPNNNPGEDYTRAHSRVLEINPFDKSIVYEYDATVSGMPRWWFSSWFVSGQQRMPNGNTFITEGANGRLFEVAPDGEIVWEYVSPFFDTRTPPSNRVYRAYKAWFWNVAPPQ